MLLFFPHPAGGLGLRRSVVAWLSDRSPRWTLHIHQANVDLPVLMAYLLASDGPDRVMRLNTVVRSAADVGPARTFLGHLVEMGRLPATTRTEVYRGELVDILGEPPAADVHLFGLPHLVDLDKLNALHEAHGGASLFLLDSGHESLLA